MNTKPSDQDSFRTLQLMSELEDGVTVSQRELASRLGVAVGLINSYLKNFVAKGYVRVKNYPRNRYAYLLTPKGFAEKGRLALHHLSYFTNLYTTTRQEYLTLFRTLQARGVEEVLFCGFDEVAEIAFLSLQETDLRLTVIMDDDGFCNGVLFGRKVLPLQEALLKVSGEIVLTSLKRGVSLRKRLRNEGWRGEIYGPPALSWDV